ncbi:MAG: transposase, partial [Spirochaetota bacterium]
MRKPRFIAPNITYHVTSRIIECKNLMEEDSIKALFEYCIMLAQAKYPFELINYQIMDNHIHLLIRTVEGGAT